MQNDNVLWTEIIFEKAIKLCFLLVGRNLEPNNCNIYIAAYISSVDSVDTMVHKPCKGLLVDSPAPMPTLNEGRMLVVLCEFFSQ